MIVYLLVIIFFIFLSNNESFDSFVDYKKVYGSNKEHKIYKDMYKCRNYEDIRLN